MKNPWKKLSTQEIYENKWIKITEDKVIHPNGKEGIFGRVHCIPSVIIIAETEDKKIVFIREYKYLVEAEIWNLIAGGMEEGADIMVTARAELREEAGVSASEIVQLGTFYTSAGHEDTIVHVLHASGLKFAKAENAGDEAISSMKLFTETEIKAMIKSGEINSAYVLAALNMFWHK